MNPIQDFIASGVLELYVMGAATPEEALAVEQMVAAHPEIRQEIETISQAMESYALAHAVAPRDVVKPLLLATIDYMERMKDGELPESPPIVTAQSRPEDYASWLNRADMVLPPDADDIYARIIGYTPAATTAIAWIKKMTDYEVHKDEYERFLIVEGTCDIIAGDETHSLKAGDFFAVPLHTPHMLKVTSPEPCKAILQRLSAA
ncbi:cupin domain-containing protein [Pontibacter sp. 172403-2]|uniref:cupin domain-containing protein n=1 Tax=Pontibacter rufus TaxID=2791028 RepID=UPI0018AFFBDF|nr:cupin domain-containing protein [Pontibacter sp. 172403-2]MBF9252555.1 cupin domain-containing protein [Pontibacter sp. 172403-2]